MSSFSSPRVVFIGKKEIYGQIDDHEFSLDSKIKDDVFKMRPLLKDFLEKYGGKSLTEYGVDIFQNQLVTPELNRRNEFLVTFKRLITERLGETIANEIVAQLEKYYVVSTADHHSPLGPSFSLNSNLIATSGYGKIADPFLKYIIVLSCASVSLNNDHFPRGLFFHVLRNEKFELERLSFLPSNSHSSAVYHFRRYLQSEVDKVQKLLNEKRRAGLIQENQVEILQEILNKIYNRPEMFECRDYSEQMTKTNLLLWKHVFSTKFFSPPDLVYLEQERVVAELIIDHHINEDTVIHRLIFDPQYLELLVQPLTVAMNKHVRQGFQGTELFWAISLDKNQRLSLHRQGEELISHDGNWRISIQPEAISKALKEGILVPNLLVVFTVLVLYYGLNCLGGFNQMHYLTSMQETYGHLALDSVSSKANTRLYDYGLQALYLKSDNEKIFVTALDLALYDFEERWRNIQQGFSQLSVKQALLVSFPEFFSILSERNQ